MAVTWVDAEPTARNTRARPGSFDNPLPAAKAKDRQALPKGVYYLDAQGRTRRNDNGARGNPIVTGKEGIATDARKAAGSGAFGGALGALSMVPQGARTLLDAATPRDAKPVVSALGDAFAGSAARAGGTVADWLRPGDQSQRTAQAERGAVSAVRGEPSRAVHEAGADYQPQHEGNRYLKATAEMLPNAAFGGGGALRRAGSVFLPGVASEGAAQIAERFTDNQDVVAGARVAGALVGGAMSAARVQREPADQRAANVLADRTRDPVSALEAEAARMRAAGVEPALMDVMGDAGRRTVRAVGTVSPAAGQTLASRAAQVTADTKPAVMARTRALTGEERTADKLVADLLAERSKAAEADYKGVYQAALPLTDDMLRALSGDPGKAALRRARAAAVARMDDAEVASIDSLLNSSLQRLPLTPDAISARARSEGFDPDTHYYHGTRQGFTDDIQPSPDGASGPGIYVSQSPTQAQNYTRGALRDGDAPNIRPLVIRAGKAEPSQGGASRVVRDPADVRSALDPFYPEGYVPPPETVSGATVDRTRIAMRERASKASRAGDNALASGLGMRESVLDNALAGDPRFEPARTGFAQRSRAIDILSGKNDARPDAFSTDPADYGTWLKDLTPEQAKANAVAIRQDILDTLGGQRAGTMGSIEQLAQSQYARQNISDALSAAGEDAGAYFANLEARLEQLGNARFVSPNTGSRTAVLDEDASRLEGLVDVAKTGVNAAHGRWVTVAADMLRRRGIGKDVAEQMALDATDPARLDAVLARLRTAKGEGAVSEFLNVRRRLLLAPVALAIGGASPDQGDEPPMQSQEPGLPRSPASQTTDASPATSAAASVQWVDEEP